MNGFLNKNLKSYAKNWLAPVKYAEMQSKNAVRNQYTNLYAYGANNPVHYIDPDGRKAGDAFNSIEEAAIDWANTYADDSIALNCEFGSTIYSFKTKEGGKNVTKYSYNIPRHGYVKSVKPNDKLEKGQKAVSVIHSHGSLIPGYDEDNPSSEDIKAAKEKNWIEYLVTPY